MSNIINEDEIDKLVADIISDYEGRRNIDAMNIFNKPDKAEVIELVNNLIRIIYPGFYRDKSYKIYNPKNSFAVNIEDAFYHLSKELYLALDYGNNRGRYSEEERKLVREGGIDAIRQVLTGSDTEKKRSLLLCLDWFMVP